MHARMTAAELAEAILAGAERTGTDLISALDLSDEEWQVLRELAAAAHTVLRCPTEPLRPDGTTHTIVGCGSTDLSGPDDEGLYDCNTCGIFFDPAKESHGTTEGSAHPSGG